MPLTTPASVLIQLLILPLVLTMLDLALPMKYLEMTLVTILTIKLFPISMTVLALNFMLEALLLVLMMNEVLLVLI